MRVRACSIFNICIVGKWVEPLFPVSIYIIMFLVGSVCCLLCIFSLRSLEAKADTGVFWQVTDIHYDKTYMKSTESGKICNSQTAGSKALTNPGKWGNYLCDSPWVLINSSVNAMREIKPNPDFIIWTGDDTAHVPNSQLSTEEVLQTIGNITDLLASNFPNVTVFPCLGNHDYHPKHLMPPTTNTIYQRVGDMWSRWLPDDAVTTFKAGGYYTTLIKLGLRLVSLNTVYYYTNNKLTANLSDPANQFSWFDNVMTNASNRKEKVYVIGHVPPGAFERFPLKKWFYPKFNKRFVELVLKHSENIAGHFLAHQHCDSFKILYDSQGNARSSLFLSPAVTPWKTTLPGVGANNPGVRLYEYDRRSLLLKDILQYFTNLTEANIRDKPEWKLEYRASSVYGIPDVSTASMQELVESFASVNSENFTKYYKFNSVSLNQDCDAECKKGQICSITKVDFDELEICLTSSTTSTTSSTTSTTSSTTSTTSSTTSTTSTIVTSSKALSQSSFKHLTAGFPCVFALLYHFIF